MYLYLKQIFIGWTNFVNNLSTSQYFYKTLDWITGMWCELIILHSCFYCEVSYSAGWDFLPLSRFLRVFHTHRGTGTLVRVCSATRWWSGNCYSFPKDQSNVSNIDQGRRLRSGLASRRSASAHYFYLFIKPGGEIEASQTTSNTSANTQLLCDCPSLPFPSPLLSSISPEALGIAGKGIFKLWM